MVFYFRPRNHGPGRDDYLMYMVRAVCVCFARISTRIWYYGPSYMDHFLFADARGSNSEGENIQR